MNTNTSADTTAPADNKTPVSLVAVLNYAWGMTMALSSQEAQRAEVESLKNRFFR
jgi:hypothetical protein